MFKRLLIISLLVLFPITALAVNYEVVEDPDTKGDQIIFFYREENDDALAFKINYRIDGAQINEITLPDDALHIPTCSNNDYFNSSNLCFDIAFKQEVDVLSPIFSLKVSKGDLTTIIDLERSSALENISLPSITPTNETRQYQTETSFMPLFIASLLALVVLLLIIIKTLRHRILTTINLLSFLILGVSILFTANYIQDSQFGPIKTVKAVINKKNIYGCYRNGFLIRLKQGVELDPETLPITTSRQTALGFDTYHIEMADKKVKSDLELDLIYKDLKAHGDILSVGFSCSGEYLATPNDPYYLSYQIPYFEQMKYNLAWDEITTSGNDVIVSVIDSGFDIHNDLNDNLWINPDESINNIDDDHNGLIDDINGWNFSNNSNVMHYADDDDIHGTSVASIIGAEGNNRIGMSGSIWDTQLLLLGTRDIIPESDLSSVGVLYALAYSFNKNATVINASYGFINENIPVCEIYDELSRKGIIIVAAAGNSTVDLDAVSGIGNYPCEYNLDNIICVGALVKGTYPFYQDRADFSNWGQTAVDIFAPGTDILSFDRLMSGTSASTPFVTAAVALYKTKYPSATPLQVKNALISSAEDISSLHGLSVSNGRLDMQAFLNTPPTGPERTNRTTDPCTGSSTTPTPTPPTGTTITPIVTTIVEPTTPEPVEDRCQLINNWAEIEGYYCAPGTDPTTVIYCDRLRQEIPDRNIECFESTCTQHPSGIADRCATDRCQQLGDRWADQSGHYCSADNNYLIYCDANKRESVNRSVRCTAGCQVNPKGVADECNQTSSTLAMEIYTSPIETLSFQGSSETALKCGPMDANDNGKIDRSDFGYMALVYSTSQEIRTCNDSSMDYGRFGSMDTNKDNIVDQKDLKVFISLLEL